MKATRWVGFVVIGTILFFSAGCQLVQKDVEGTESVSGSDPTEAEGRVTARARGEEKKRGADGDDHIKSTEFVVMANKSPLVRLQKRLPAEVVHGEEFSYDLVITAANDAEDITVTDTIPAGASFVRSNPAANRDAHQLFWRFPSLKKDGAEWIRVWLKADRAGELVSCPTISAMGQSCVGTIAGTPQLDLRVVTAESAIANFAVQALMVVSNRGTITARDVLVRHKLPEGLVHSAKEQPLVFNAGDLAPGQAKSIKLQLKPVGRGRAQLQATATSSNTAPVEAVASTMITEPKVELTLEGAAEEYINKKATYKINLRNVGDATLTSVVLTHDAGPRTTIIEAAEADTIRTRSATWKIDTLRPGERRAFDVMLSSSSAGSREHTVSVTAAEGIEERAVASTDWKGLSALALELADSPDPVQVGHQTTYTIRVSNQGTGSGSDVAVVATLPPQLSPVKTSAGEFEGNTIRFPAITNLPPKKSIAYKITVKGATVGDARMRVELRSADLKTPVIEEESTRVY